MAGERGSPDTWRDPRGFALKMYTSDGNFDIVGNNTPVFFIRDPMEFQHFIRSQKRMQATNLRDHHMQWDFWTLSPESAHRVGAPMCSVTRWPAAWSLKELVSRRLQIFSAINASTPRRSTRSSICRHYVRSRCLGRRCCHDTFNRSRLG